MLSLGSALQDDTMSADVSRRVESRNFTLSVFTSIQYERIGVESSSGACGKVGGTTDRGLSPSRSTAYTNPPQLIITAVKGRVLGAYDPK